MAVASRAMALACALACLLAGSGRAQPPPLSCAAIVSVIPLVRAGGVAEQTGDLVLTCTGGTPTPAGVNVPQVNIEVRPSNSGGAQINPTSRVLIASQTWTEALLLVDDPSPTATRLCGSTNAPEANPGNALPVLSGVCARVEGTGTGTGTYDLATPTTPDTDFYRVNAFQGRRVLTGSTTVLRFPGVPFDPPGAGTRVLRITNVRINAAQLGVPAGAQDIVRLDVSMNGGGLASPIVPPITNATPTAAIAENMLTFEVLDSQSFLQNLDVNPAWVNGSFPPPALAMTLRFLELRPHVLKRRNAAASSADTPIEQDVPGTLYGTESIFFRDEPDTDDWPEELTAANQASGFARGRVSGTVAGTLGLGDHGTRLIAQFSGVPEGVRLFVENAPQIELAAGGTATGTLQLVQADATCAGPYAAAPANSQGFTEVALIAGAGTACWEVLTTNDFSPEQALIQVVAAYESDVPGGLPALGTARAAGQLAPINSFSIGGDATIPIPRFVNGMVPEDLFVIVSTASDIPAASLGALLALALLLGVASWRLLRPGA